MDSNSHFDKTPPVGFMLGALGGLALSMGLVGLILGMSIGGMSSIGLLGAGQQIAQNPTAPTLPPEPAPSGPVPPVGKDDHVRGNPNAKVTVIEYSDFECPFCKRHHPTMTQLMTQYGNDINWVYRHFPLSFHPSAQKAAEASECVAELGGNDAFWKYADALMELPQISLDLLAPTAKSIGVNEAQFKTCLDSGKYAQKVADQMSSGGAAGVNGTPGSFVINNDDDSSQIVSGAVPLASFTAIIDGMVK